MKGGDKRMEFLLKITEGGDVFRRLIARISNFKARILKHLALLILLLGLHLVHCSRCITSDLLHVHYASVRGLGVLTNFLLTLHVLLKDILKLSISFRCQVDARHETNGFSLNSYMAHTEIE